MEPYQRGGHGDHWAPFEQQGLAPDESALGGAPAVTAALLGGSLDIGLAAVDAHVRSVERGANAVWFMTEYNTPIYGLLARSNISSDADLRGQTVVVDAPNGVTFWLTRRMLAQAGLGPDDYNFIFAGGTPELFAQKRDVLAARCADIGRDPKAITMSAHLRLEPDRNYGKVIEDAAGLAGEGLDLGIVYISPPHDPTVLEPLAEAIRESGLWNK